LTTLIKINFYLGALSFLLFLIVLDQGHALKQLSEMNNLNSQTADDYWFEIQKDEKQIKFLQDKSQQDQANFDKYIRKETRERRYLGFALDQTDGYLESLARCSIFNLRMDFCEMDVDKIHDLLQRNRKMLGYH
jgi:hypothetical protein